MAQLRLLPACLWSVAAWLRSLVAHLFSLAGELGSHSDLLSGVGIDLQALSAAAVLEVLT